jgi:molybdopterin converting factor small subunit
MENNIKDIDKDELEFFTDDDDDWGIEDTAIDKEEDYKDVITLENTKRIADFLDGMLETTDLSKSLKDDMNNDLESINSRRKILITRATDSIDISDLSIADKEKEVAKLDGLSLEDLEKKYGREKSKELQHLENTSIRKIVNNFAKGYRDDIKDNNKIENSFDTYLAEKAPKIIEKTVEESDIFKTYQAKMSKYLRENKPTDSAFTKLLNIYANLPTKLLEQVFKEALKDSCKIELEQQKNHLVDNIKHNLVINKNKSKEQDR